MAVILHWMLRPAERIGRAASTKPNAFRDSRCCMYYRHLSWAPCRSRFPYVLTSREVIVQHGDQECLDISCRIDLSGWISTVRITTQPESAVIHPNIEQLREHLWWHRSNIRPLSHSTCINMIDFSFVGIVLSNLKQSQRATSNRPIKTNKNQSQAIPSIPAI